MINLASDYIKGCHPRILEKLSEINNRTFTGYGTDEYCESAAAKIKEAFGCPDATVRFISGGTQTNQLVIDTVLDATEGVISVETGHVATHEAGAIEFSGHKVISLPHHNGLMDPDELKDFLDTFFADANHEHMVYPGMVYLTFPSEFGTIYTRAQLQAISDICRSYKLPLYIDGARLGYGLAASDGDICMKDIGALADIFYIGGTKIGALFGEAVVFHAANVPARLTTRIKQHGALLAKGWIAGVQFDTLFTDDLYMEMSRNAIDKAGKLRKLMLDAGYTLYLDSPTNQQFFIVDNEKLQKMGENVVYSFWEKYDESHTVIRLATSFATTDKEIEELQAFI